MAFYAGGPRLKHIRASLLAARSICGRYVLCQHVRSVARSCQFAILSFSDVVEKARKVWGLLGPIGMHFISRGLHQVSVGSDHGSLTV